MASPKRSEADQREFRNRTDAFGTARLSVWEGKTGISSRYVRQIVASTTSWTPCLDDSDSDSDLYSMTDYLNARARGRSESVNTDASSTVVSPLPTPGPITNPKLTPLIGTKFPVNTILKSHGRPPWYYMGRAPEGREVLSVF